MKANPGDWQRISLNLGKGAKIGWMQKSFVKNAQGEMGHVLLDEDGGRGFSRDTPTYVPNPFEAPSQQVNPYLQQPAARPNPFANLPKAGSMPLPSYQQPSVNMTLPGVPDQPMTSPAGSGYAPGGWSWDNPFGMFSAAPSQAQGQQEQVSWLEKLFGSGISSQRGQATNYPDAPISLELNEPGQPAPYPVPPTPANSTYQPSGFDWSNPFKLFAPAQSGAQGAMSPYGTNWSPAQAQAMMYQRGAAQNYADSPLAIEPLAPLQVQAPARPSGGSSWLPSLTFGPSAPTPQVRFQLLPNAPQSPSQAIQYPIGSPATSNNLPLYLGIGVVGAALLALLVLRSD